MLIIKRTVFGRVAAAALLALCALFATMDTTRAAEPDSTLVIETRDGPHTFRVETARTPGEQARGLMFRRELADDAGMIFLYASPQPIHMWMKNTYIPLDMLFIAADGKIARIERMTEPFSEETISSGAPVTAILEIPGGRARALNIRRGDLVRHPHFGTR